MNWLKSLLGLRMSKLEALMSPGAAVEEEGMTGAFGGVGKEN